MTCICSFRREKWGALRRPISRRSLVVVAIVWGSPDPPLLHGSQATRAAMLCCSISAQFPGIAQFSTRCLTSSLAALHPSSAHCALNMASQHRLLSHHRDTTRCFIKRLQNPCLRDAWCFYDWVNYYSHKNIVRHNILQWGVHFNNFFCCCWR